MTVLQAVAEYLSFRYSEFRHGHFEHDPQQHCLTFHSNIPVEQFDEAHLSRILASLDIGILLFIWLDPNDYEVMVETNILI